MNLLKTALLVDDEDHIRFAVRRLLKSCGIGLIHESTNGEEAVRKYSAVKPDLVIMDINMPVMDGLEALEKIKEIDPSVTAIMLTAQASVRAVTESIEKGAYFYIRKDLGHKEIGDSLRRVIEEINERRALSDMPE